jgi:hypothetical protein
VESGAVSAGKRGAGGGGGGSIAKAAVAMTSVKTAGILFLIGVLIARFNLFECPTARL